LPYLKKCGIDVTISPLLDDEYIRRQYETGRFSLLPLPRIYAGRTVALLRSGRFDAVWVEKEALPWLPCWLERLLGLGRVAYVLDYDDAIYHTYDQHPRWLVRRLLGRKIAGLMRGAAVVMVGNDYLREYAERAGATRIGWVPSVVDLGRYPARVDPQNDVFTIGWWGSPANSQHLRMIDDALAEVCRDGGGRLRVFGGWKVELRCDVPVEYTPFSPADEVEPTYRCDVGVMPLPDAPWERGKCGLKLIHYMACELPVVASPVGVNGQIVEHGVTGFVASTARDWIDALRTLRESPDLRKRMGQAGRRKVERLYSLQVTAPRVASMLLAAGGEYQLPAARNVVY
jgi:glycosyltransferase involved in cell wall biosynthesis